jgi:hypothetical protein
MRRSTSGTVFWEGGTGQRNKSHMSRKESKKMSDSGLKTKSKKSERVGQAGSGARKKEPQGKTFERYRLVMVNGKQTGVVETVAVKRKLTKKFA